MAESEDPIDLRAIRDSGVVNEIDDNTLITFAILDLVDRLDEVGEDRSLLPAPLATLTLVNSAQGVIDNGGLDYFFACDFDPPRPYAEFIDAYRAIGANMEADALQSAVGVFSFDQPELHRAKRNEVLDRYRLKDSSLHREGSPFNVPTKRLCGNKRVWSLFATYVRKHIDLF